MDTVAYAFFYCLFPLLSSQVGNVWQDGYEAHLLFIADHEVPISMVRFIFVPFMILMIFIFKDCPDPYFLISLHLVM